VLSSGSVNRLTPEPVIHELLDSEIDP
jgi:hypothetical protein